MEILRTTAWVLLPFIIVGLLGASVAKQTSRDDGVPITYGSVLKLMHKTTTSRLHASDVRYNTGGHFYVVTGYRGVDSSSYWVVKPGEGSSSKQGDSIPDGSVIRLQHVKTHNWLHSRSQPSPLSNNLEVSCREGRDENTGDLWRLEFVDKSEVWRKDHKVRLKHVDTGSFLHSHEMKYMKVIPGEMEVCGVLEESYKNVWVATEGVYLYVASSTRQEDSKEYAVQP